MSNVLAALFNSDLMLVRELPTYVHGFQQTLQSILAEPYSISRITTTVESCFSYLSISCHSLLHFSINYTSSYRPWPNTSTCTKEAVKGLKTIGCIA